RSSVGALLLIEGPRRRCGVRSDHRPRDRTTDHPTWFSSSELGRSAHRFTLVSEEGLALIVCGGLKWNIPPSSRHRMGRPRRLRGMSFTREVSLPGALG